MVARLYAVSRRTLYRHLKAEGGTFRQVANEVRCEIACTLLAETDMPLRQITEILNYSEISAFSRAFRRWAGQPPRSGAAVIARVHDGHGVADLKSWLRRGDRPFHTALYASNAARLFLRHHVRSGL